MHKLNAISIKAYLAQYDIHPVKEKGNIAMYYSPLREDTNASFKVDLEKNLWIDFGTGEGGTMIDLVMKLKKCTLYDAIVELEQTDVNPSVGTDSFSFHGKESTPLITIERVEELAHPALLQYLDKRAIDIGLAREYCKQVHYTTNDRNYFAIGFKNDSDGWNLRSEYFKGCTSMDISTCRAVDKNTALVFEGFMDYLSYLSMNNLGKSTNNIIVLNSTSNLNKTIDFIKSHDKVYTYLDNDEGGRKATQLINQVCKAHFNKSTEFANFKDLNECHVAKQKAKKQEVKQKPSRGLRR